MAERPITLQGLNEGLLTLDPPDGKPPQTRMASATQARDMVVQAIRRDMDYRDWKRSLLKGLVDGNKPYSTNALIDAGRADECNVNWRIAKYFLSQAQGMLYDTVTEAETLALVDLDPWHKEAQGMDVQAFPDWSHIVTEEFDRLQKSDDRWDYAIQQSQGQMVLYGCGPLVFEDEYDWRCESFESRVLLLPEWTKSSTQKWEWAALIVEYSPDRLYARIQNPSVAQERGWNVPATRAAIMNAHPLTRTGVMFQNWSWHQDLLKNGTYYYASQSKIIRTAHFYFREFPEDGEDEGKITECMIDLDALYNASQTGEIEYLFRKQRRYTSWNEVIHPMYWQSDVNGYHHSVTGLGIEMYAALEYENRLLCRLADDAFAPKLFFKPTVASDRERMSIAQYGRYGVLPAALEMVQQHVQPFLQDGIAMSREIQGLVQSNLSQFRSQAMTKAQGNPATATQVNYEASEQAKMGKTQLSRIYEQYDWLYREKYRRATNKNMTDAVRGGDMALDFIRRCEMRGVPKKALQCVGEVQSNRAVGQGSQFLRQQALEFLLGLLGTLPEQGRTNLIRDVVASRAGQDKVDRYAPKAGMPDPGMAQQQSDAMQQVASMKVGVPPVPTPMQNPMVYATTFLQAAQGAVQAVQQGAHPSEATSFLDLALPAIGQQMQRMSMDKSRANDLRTMDVQVKELSAANDKLKAQLAQAQQEQAQAQAQMGQTNTDLQVGMAKVQARHQVDVAKADAKHRLDVAKTGAKLNLDAERQRAELGLKANQQQFDHTIDDAETAHSMALENVQAHHDRVQSHVSTLHDMHLAQAKAEAAAKQAAMKPKNGAPAKKS